MLAGKNMRRALHPVNRVFREILYVATTKSSGKADRMAMAHAITFPGRSGKV
jgi:hypothetical protein